MRASGLLVREIAFGCLQKLLNGETFALDSCGVHQRKLDGDNEETTGDTFFNQAKTLQSQGDMAYSSGNYVQAKALYQQAAAMHGEADKHFQLSINGYAGAVQYWKLAIR